MNIQSMQQKMKWLTDQVWEELKELQLCEPFTRDNLTRHILMKQEEWNDFYNLGDEQTYDLDSLPNKDLIIPEKLKETYFEE